MNNDVLKKIKLLSSAYAKQLPKRITALADEWHALKDNETRENIEQMILSVHNLSGTAGTYGYQSVSHVATLIEHALHDHPDALTPELITNVNALIQDLKQLAIEPPQTDLHAKVEFKHLSDSEERTIFILDHDEMATTHQIQPIKQFNYKVKVFDEINHFLNEVTLEKPDMLVIDVDFADQIPSETVKKFREDLIIIIFYGKQDDLQARLKTVRHGGQAFLTKPFEVEALLRTFDNLFQAKMTQNARILIVDDSEFLANYYAELLKQVDLLTAVVNDPKVFLLKLREFQPDLILMDVNMPYCNGIELAQIVHQQENLSGIPIVFLSSISERNRQLEVLSYAGDDFLSKPVDPKHLLAVVHHRLMRSRILRARMMRDSLTNLYNHTMINHQLERELAVSERYGKNLCVALFDIDHFKEVNDTSGHQVGDKILKDLSLFLEKRLRKSDLIGRYGGEEFLIILPNTDLQSGFEIIDKLRRDFSHIRHPIGDNDEMTVTFSGGIAAYPAVKDSAELVKAADKALYEAKECGRNCVMIAHEK